MNYKEIEKEFEQRAKKIYGYYYRCGRDKIVLGGELTKAIEENLNLKDFLKAKINQIIDEAIGEKKYYLRHTKNLRELEKAIGYNQKVQAGKDFKKRFNKE